MRKKIALVIVVCLLVSAMMAACAPAGEKPPVKEKIVTWLDPSDLTGPVSGIQIDWSKGYEDYVAEWNKKGGWNGVTVNYITLDARYDVARAISCYRRYLGAPKFLWVRSTATSVDKALTPLITGKQILSSVNDGEIVAHPGWAFNCGPAYQNGFGAVCDWALADWESKGKSGKPRIGVVHWDNPFGKEWQRGGLEYAESKGITVNDVGYATSAVDFKPYLTTLEEKGMDYLVIWVVEPSISSVGVQAHEMGLDKSVEAVIYNWWGPVRTCGLKYHAEELKGHFLLAQSLQGTDLDNNELAAGLATKYRGSIDNVGDGYSLGVAGSVRFITALERALDKVGYEKLDAYAFKEAVEGLTGLDPGGCQGITAWSPTDRNGSWYVKFYEFDGTTKAKPITDWVKCPDTVSLHTWD